MRVSMDKELNQKLAKHMLEENIKRAVKNVKDSFKNNNPSHAKLVDSRVDVLVYNKRPKGHSKVVPDLVKIMLIDDNVNLTLKELLEKVRKEHPKQKLSYNIWHKPLIKYQKDAILKVLKDNDYPVSIMRNCKQLSHVRNKIKLRVNAKNKKRVEFKVNVVMTSSNVIVNDKVYSVTRRGRGNHPYIRVETGKDGKRDWLRADVLGKLLIKTTKL